MPNSHETARRRAMNTPVHSRYGEGRHRNTAGSIVSILNAKANRLRRAARLALQNPTRRALLKLLATNRNGLTYADLFRALPVSERWVREIVADLRREGVVETPGNPALIRFTSHEMAVAVKELLAFLASEWTDAITNGDSSRTGLSDHPSNRSDETYLKTMVGIIRGRGG